ncbi:MAG TPA: phosphatase PAP2 family protein [Polyangiaceae bacterium]|jgi:membrane-associated phospholipid phosphatase|nr:phosphatase PAP2 family protein [Polyangiaceae bacterium]
MPFSVLTRCRSRRTWLLGAAAAAALLGVCSSARAGEPCSEVAPWDGLGRTGRNFVRPVPLTLTILAVATPFGFAPTGVDQRLRIVAQRDLGGRPNLEPVSVWTPYVLGGGLLVGYAISAAASSCSSERVLVPVIQAGVITFSAVSLLKLGVGRRFPNGGTDPNAADRLDHPERAHDFTPFRRGFGAWPSGHTALLFSGAASFRASNPELGVVAFLGYPLALGVAAGMWLGDHHYTSDIVSGALLGEAIGDSVGQSFAGALGLPGALTLLPSPGSAAQAGAASGFEVEWAGAW